jgi:hypothetical protein
MQTCTSQRPSSLSWFTVWHHKIFNTWYFDNLHASSYVYVCLCSLHWKRPWADWRIINKNDCSIITYAISAYHHWSCEFESRPGEVYLIQHFEIKPIKLTATHTIRGWTFFWAGPNPKLFKKNLTQVRSVICQVPICRIKILLACQL